MTEQSQLGPSYDGTVMLDIGGDIGALIILTSAELLLAELELSRVDGTDATPPSELHNHSDHSHEHAHDDHGHEHGHGHDDHGHSHSAKRTHVAVRERRGPGGVRYAAIYPGLREGEYTVYDVEGQPVENVLVVGGEVAQLDWR